MCHFFSFLLRWSLTLHYFSSYFKSSFFCFVRCLSTQAGFQTGLLSKQRFAEGLHIATMTPGTGMWLAASPPAQTCFDNEQTSFYWRKRQLLFHCCALNWKYSLNYKQVLQCPVYRDSLLRRKKKRNTAFQISSLSSCVSKQVWLFKYRPVCLS